MEVKRYSCLRAFLDGNDDPSDDVKDEHRENRSEESDAHKKQSNNRGIDIQVLGQTGADPPDHFLFLGAVEFFRHSLFPSHPGSSSNKTSIHG